MKALYSIIVAIMVIFAMNACKTGHSSVQNAQKKTKVTIDGVEVDSLTLSHNKDSIAPNMVNDSFYYYEAGKQKAKKD